MLSQSWCDTVNVHLWQLVQQDFCRSSLHCAEHILVLSCHHLLYLCVLADTQQASLVGALLVSSRILQGLLLLHRTTNAASFLSSGQHLYVFAGIPCQLPFGPSHIAASNTWSEHQLSQCSRAMQAGLMLSKHKPLQPAVSHSSDDAKAALRCVFHLSGGPPSSHSFPQLSCNTHTGLYVRLLLLVMHCRAFNVHPCFAHQQLISQDSYIASYAKLTGLQNVSEGLC